jgi:hypothetical protein
MKFLFAAAIFFVAVSPNILPAREGKAIAAILIHPGGQSIAKRKSD